MNDELLVALEGLIRESLKQWGCGQALKVSRGTDGVLTLTSDQSVLTIERASREMPFRWIVHVEQRRRAAASVVGVLRMIRETFAIGYAPSQIVIAPLPQAPR